MKCCDYCGRENDEAGTHCTGCATEFSRPPVDKSPSAGFWIRALARIMDMSFGLAMGMVAGMIAIAILQLLALAGLAPAGWQHRIDGFSLAAMGFGFLGEVIYHWLCEGIHGATLGKLCCGLRVVSEDGSPATLRGALIRSLAYPIDSFFCGGVGYNSMRSSPQNQRYGDVWGKTAVFKIKGTAAESQRTLTQFGLGMLAGVAGGIFVLVMGNLWRAF